MNVKRLAICLSASLLALTATGAAGGDHSSDSERASERKHHSGDLVRVVRDATWRFRDVNQAEAEGYQLLFGCVSGHDGAMGLHYVNMALVGDGVLDPRRPE
jgi:hypothetical protein